MQEKPLDPRGPTPLKKPPVKWRQAFRARRLRNRKKYASITCSLGTVNFLDSAKKEFEKHVSAFEAEAFAEFVLSEKSKAQSLDDEVPFYGTSWFSDDGMELRLNLYIDTKDTDNLCIWVAEVHKPEDADQASAKEVKSKLKQLADAGLLTTTKEGAKLLLRGLFGG